jgi:hypothetical protein
MNLGPLIVLFKLFEGQVSPTIGPPANPQNVNIKPLCGPGHYAYKDPLTGLWSCLLIPKGR